MQKQGASKQLYPLTVIRYRKLILSSAMGTVRASLLGWSPVNMQRELSILEHFRVMRGLDEGTDINKHISILIASKSAV